MDRLSLRKKTSGAVERIETARFEICEALGVASAPPNKQARSDRRQVPAETQVAAALTDLAIICEVLRDKLTAEASAPTPKGRK